MWLFKINALRAGLFMELPYSIPEGIVIFEIGACITFSK